MWASLAAFAELGYHGTTTREIARRAEMSPAAIYLHHESKQALLYKLMVKTHHEILRRVEAAAATDGTPTERMRRLIKVHVDWHAADAVAARVANNELHCLSREQRGEVRKIRIQVEAVLQGVLDDGIRSGEFQVNRPDSTLVAILSLGMDVSRWWRGGDKISASELADLYSDLVLRMIGAPRLGQRNGTRSARSSARSRGS
jgi:AcrR family transcriptional regulator